VQAYLHSAVGAALIPHLPLPLLNQHHLPLITNLFDLNTHHPISGISYLLHFAIASVTLICRLNNSSFSLQAQNLPFHKSFPQ